jgi:hypothetical protein
VGGHLHMLRVKQALALACLGCARWGKATEQGAVLCCEQSRPAGPRGCPESAAH